MNISGRNQALSFVLVSALSIGWALPASAAFLTFEANGSTPASITATRDSFRTAVGGGTVAGANGDFGGLRREINWDGVPDIRSDPNSLPGDFFNTNSPRGAVFSTPGTGFLTSANAGGAASTLFGFPNDLQTFSAQRLFAIIGSNVMDVSFFVPGTSTPATTSAFGLIFVDVEIANETKMEFYDSTNSLIYSKFALTAGNQGLTFLGAVANAGEKISRVRITLPTNFLVSNGVLDNTVNDFVVMDDFLYATPTADTSNVPEPASIALVGLGLVAANFLRKQ